MILKITKYKNRKLYSKDASKYVTLSELYEFIKSGHTIEVTSQDEEQDLTIDVLKEVVKCAKVKQSDLYNIIQRG